MKRKVKETINGDCEIKLLYDDEEIFKTNGVNAGIEIEDNYGKLVNNKSK